MGKYTTLIGYLGVVWGWSVIKILRYQPTHQSNGMSCWWVKTEHWAYTLGICLDPPQKAQRFQFKSNWSGVFVQMGCLTLFKQHSGKDTLYNIYIYNSIHTEYLYIYIHTFILYVCIYIYMIHVLYIYISDTSSLPVFFSMLSYLLFNLQVLRALSWSVDPRTGELQVWNTDVDGP